MNRFSVFVSMCLTLVMSPGPPTLQARNLDLATAAIVLRVYNIAQVPRKTLDLVKEQTVRTFQKSGFQVIWLNMGDPIEQSAVVPAGSRALSVVIFPQLPAYVGATPDAMGAVVDGVVEAFYARIQSFVDTFTLPPTFRPLLEALVLSSVVTHEIGHLMRLPHSGDGVMRPNWLGRDFWPPDSGRLHFSKDEADRIRAELNRGQH